MKITENIDLRGTIRELSQDEKQTIDAQIEILSEIRNPYEIEDELKRIAAEQTILSFGESALPYLITKVNEETGLDPFDFANFYYELGTYKSIDLGLEFLESPLVQKLGESSTLNRMCFSLASSCKTLRAQSENKDNSEQLRSLFVRTKSLLEANCFACMHSQDPLLKVIACSGTPEAEVFSQGSHSLAEYFTEYSSIPSRLPYSVFKTRDEYLRFISPNLQGNAVSGSSIYDYYEDDYPIEPHVTRVEVVNNETEKAVQQALEIVNNLHTPSTAKAALAVNIYNLISKPGSTQQEIDIKVNKLLAKVETEIRYLWLGVYPTVGLEIEVPIAVPLDSRKSSIAEKLGVKGYTDATARWEYKTTPSASPLMQSLLVHGLIDGGFLPTKTSDNDSTWPMLRVHLNLGMPEDIRRPVFEDFVGRHDTRDKTNLLVAALSTAFASHRRIYGANYSNPFRYQTDVSEVGEQNYGTGNPVSGRLEIRSLDINGPNFYRLLAEAQDITACLQAQIRKDIGENLTEEENLRAKIWREFEQQARITFDLYQIDYKTAVVRGNSNRETAKVMRDTGLSLDMRSLITNSRLKIYRSEPIMEALELEPA